jgi:hypothetical protein
MAAAGEGEHASFSLLLETTIALVNEERKRSLGKVTSELREARGAKLYSKAFKMGYVICNLYRQRAAGDCKK